MAKIDEVRKLEILIKCDCGNSYEASLKKGQTCPKCKTDHHIVLFVKSQKNDIGLIPGTRGMK